jgi:AcrR family transcriptional regulator
MTEVPVTGKVRSDTKRNRKYLIRAAGELFAAADGPINMVDLASHAEISTATAYRHFNSVADVLTAYRYDVGLQLNEYSQKQTINGLPLLEAVSQKWVLLVVKNGAAMVHTRSPEGYLARLRQRPAYLQVQADALERPLREATAELGLDDLGDEGMFLWNILFDPREIFDLIGTLGLTPAQASARLMATFKGALAGWAAGKKAD